MKTCPYCNAKSLSLIRKFTTTPSIGFKCKKCGNIVTIPKQFNYLPLLLFIFIIIVQQNFDAPIPYIAYAVGISVMLFILIRVPFVKYGPDIESKKQDKL